MSLRVDEIYDSVSAISTDILSTVETSCSALDEKIDGVSSILSDYVRKDSLSGILSDYTYVDVPLSDIDFDSLTFGQMSDMLKFMFKRFGGYQPQT